MYLSRMCSVPYTYRTWEQLGAVSIRKTVLPGMAIPMLKIRLLTTVLSLSWKSPYVDKTVFILRRGPDSFSHTCYVWSTYRRIHMRPFLHNCVALYHKMVSLVSLSYILLNVQWHLWWCCVKSIQNTNSYQYRYSNIRAFHAPIPHIFLLIT